MTTFAKMRRLSASAIWVLIIFIVWALPAAAHFQEIIPSADVLPEGGSVTLDMVFEHPMGSGPNMEMAKPERFAVKQNGKVIELNDQLQKQVVKGKTAWTADYALQRPGAAQFFVVPQPYWEAAEQIYIVHYAKVVVDAYASGEGWDDLIGLPVEIQPLVRPTGLWTGNIFRGVVLKNGKPVPDAEIEVEYVNHGQIKVPNDAFYTQVIKADAQGVFVYAMPRAGWWGFAALLESDDKRPSPDGKTMVPTELGALMWVKTTDMQEQ